MNNCRNEHSEVTIAPRAFSVIWQFFDYLFAQSQIVHAAARITCYFLVVCDHPKLDAVIKEVMLKSNTSKHSESRASVLISLHENRDLV